MIDVVARLYRAEEDFAPTPGKAMVPEIESYAAKHAIPLAKVDLARAVKVRLLKMKDTLPEEIRGQSDGHRLSPAARRPAAIRVLEGLCAFARRARALR